jgi:TATA-box binding protein (TBP) (component of TFIID and TFIIIB)
MENDPVKKLFERAFGVQTGRIGNVVSKFWLNKRILLDAVKSLGKYNPERFAAVLIQGKYGRIMIFKSGNATQLGVKDETKDCVLSLIQAYEVRNILRSGANIRSAIVNFRITNRVVLGFCGFRTPQEELKRYLKDQEDLQCDYYYEPNTFSGLFIFPQFMKPASIIFFETGKFNVVGIREDSLIQTACAWAKAFALRWYYSRMHTSCWNDLDQAK